MGMLIDVAACTSHALYSLLFSINSLRALWSCVIAYLPCIAMHIYMLGLLQAEDRNMLIIFMLKKTKFRTLVL